MIIIKMWGGLGNQMFEYALYRALKARGKDVTMDDVTGFADDKQRVPMLETVFGITYARATRQQVLDMTDRDRHLKNWLRRRFGIHRAKVFTERDDGNFDEAVFDVEEGYLAGYWQSERYFADGELQKDLRREFRLDPARVGAGQTSLDLLEEIEKTDSVSIHIRRGDYLLPQNEKLFGGICTEEYYRNAIGYMLERYPRAVFYIFSNDPEWTAQHFAGDRFVTVSAAGQEADAADMLLMSACSHHIIANSSYSWWAAWLNGREDKTVVAPSRWINTKEMRDIYTERMVRI